MSRKLFAIFGVLILIGTISMFQTMDSPTISKTGYSMTTSTATAAGYNGAYVASSNSNVYHKHNCRYTKKIKPHNKIQFKNRAEAEKRGYTPCKICKP